MMSIKKSLFSAVCVGSLLFSTTASAALQQDPSIQQLIEDSNSVNAPVTESFRITVNGIFPESEYESLFNGSLENAPTYSAEELKAALNPQDKVELTHDLETKPTLRAKSQQGLTGQHVRAKRGKSYVVKGVRYTPFSSVSEFTETGEASWYGPGFHGRKTANGERYNQNALTAAHKELPINSVVRVTHESTGKSVVVRINDRGPFHGDRVIDMSYAAAKAIGMVQQGKANVRIELLPKGKPTL
ncbi:MAG: septal ring lytic transglycosylase RlpA family protein [Alcaligenaceae bacterium]|jgi:rare lipoprotein A (peptidoglycan hydrolase)|nr:septal ring lytic transglycosylase RlpA family protein [Alcaligenaceae bacterium]